MHNNEPITIIIIALLAIISMSFWLARAVLNRGKWKPKHDQDKPPQVVLIDTPVVNNGVNASIFPHEYDGKLNSGTTIPSPNASGKTRAKVSPILVSKAWRQSANARLEKLMMDNPSIASKTIEIKNSLLCFALGDMSAPRLIILYGAPGVGKSHYARMISNAIAQKVHQHTLATLKARFIGATAELVNEALQDAATEGCSAVIIDEADVLFSNRVANESSDVMTREAVGAILPWLDGSKANTGKSIVILTGNTIDYDQAILSRADFVIRVDPPSEMEMNQIATSLLKKYEILDTKLATWIAREMVGMSPRDLESVIRSIRQEVLSGTSFQASVNKIPLRIADFRKKCNAGFTPCEFKDVSLPHEIKDKIERSLVIYENSPLLTTMKIQSRFRPMLFSGPPGVGKTMIARAIASRLNGGFSQLSPDTIFSKVSGVAAEKVKEAFATARSRRPSVLFIDELDCFCGNRMRSNLGQTHMEVMSVLLAELDGSKTDHQYQPMIVAATNHPEMIDAAILSRFLLIDIPQPGYIERKSIFISKLVAGGVSHEQAAFCAIIVRMQIEHMNGREIASYVHAIVERWAIRCVDAKKKLDFSVTDLDSHTILDRAA